MQREFARPAFGAARLVLRGRAGADADAAYAYVSGLGFTRFATEDLDEADFVGVVQIEDQMAVNRLQLDNACNLDLRRGSKTSAILVAAIADRFDSQCSQLGLERVRALLFQEIGHLLDQIG